MSASEMSDSAVEADLPVTGRLIVVQRRLTIVCAVLLSASIFFLFARGGLGGVARLALLLVAFVGGFAWLFLPALRQRPGHRREILLWVALPLLAYFLAALTVRQIHADPVSVLDKPVRSLAAVIGLFVWLHLRLDGKVFRKVLFNATIAAGPLALSVALYERYVLGIDRVGEAIYPIQFADMSMTVTMLCIVLAFSARSPAARWFAAVGALCAFISVWMTGSRGAFLALAVLPWVIAYARGQRLSMRMLVQVVLALVLANSLALLASPSMRERMLEAQTDLQFYSGGHAATSLGMRLQMWNNAAAVFRASPVAGAGSLGYIKSQREGVAAGRLDPAILEFNGAHNQYLDAFARGGLILGMATCALFLFPLMWFRRQCRQPGFQTFAACGFALTAAFPIYALTQHIFNHGTGMMFFASGICLFVLATILPGSDTTH